MKKLLIALLVIVVLVVAVGFLLPTSYRIEERVTIQATPAEIHEHVGQLEKWEAWTPWIEMDPTMVVSYGDQVTGVGASQTWTGESGDGELIFTKCDPKTGIEYDMAFIMEGTRAPAVSAMIYEAKGESTDVVWTMEGDVSDFMPAGLAGYMNLAMKASISASFRQGLEKLKVVVEG